MTCNTSSPIRILYVEDDKILQLSLAQMLEILGYEVACADNGNALAHLGRGGNGRQQLLEAGAGIHGALGVAYGVVGDGLPVICCQQVRPISVAVGVGAACCPDVADKRRPRPSAGTLILPRRVPDPPGREIFPRAAGFQI